MVWLISGPSSAGKSKFVQHKHCSRVTGVATGTAKLCFPSLSPGVDEKADTAFLHYNIMRPIHVERNKATRHTQIRLASYKTDGGWINWCQRQDMGLTAVVLVCAQKDLLSRAAKRQDVEPELQSSLGSAQYDRDFWCFLYQTVDMKRIYHAWLQELARCKIGYLMLDSSCEAYSVISTLDEMDAVVDRP